MSNENFKKDAPPLLTIKTHKSNLQKLVFSLAESQVQQPFCIVVQYATQCSFIARGLVRGLGGVSNAPPSDLRHLRHPPDDLGCCRTLRTPTTASTRHRRGLLAVLNIALTIAALRGEMPDWQNAVYPRLPTAAASRVRREKVVAPRSACYSQCRAAYRRYERRSACPVKCCTQGPLV